MKLAAIIFGLLCVVSHLAVDVLLVGKAGVDYADYSALWNLSSIWGVAALIFSGLALLEKRFTRQPA